jgi:hypothetical protein
MSVELSVSKIQIFLHNDSVLPYGRRGNEEGRPPKRALPSSLICYDSIVGRRETIGTHFVVGGEVRR